jgi:hypothetical protein
VKCLGYNEKGQLRLSRRQILLRENGAQQTASGIPPAEIAAIATGANVGGSTVAATVVTDDSASKVKPYSRAPKD